jgi:hypothetical protein
MLRQNGMVRRLLCRPDHLHTNSSVITWRDPPGWFDEILLGVMKYGVLSAGIIFFVWGVGYKLAFWGQGNSDAVFVSAFDVILPNLALVTGVVIAGWGYLRYFRR